MRKFDVFRNLSDATRSFAPYVLVLQSHHLSPLETVVVAPMVRDANKPVSTVDLAITFNDESLVISVSELGAVARRDLRRKEGHLGDLQDQIDRALDRLFSGF